MKQREYLVHGLTIARAKNRVVSAKKHTNYFTVVLLPYAKSKR